jgi:hypothetical protein
MLLHVGFFDWYELQEPRTCALCGDPLDGEWQGKDGPCALFVWRQGLKHPVDQKVDDEVALTIEDRDTRTLPSEFAIYTFCRNDHAAWVSCSCVDDVWVGAGPVTRYPPPSKFDTRAQRRARRNVSEA